MSISDAVKELRDAIEQEGFNSDLVKEIARDYGMNPILLARKFEEQFGVEPAKYVSNKVGDDFIDKIIASELKKYSGRFVYDRANDQFIGKRFTYLGQKYAFVAYFGNQVAAVDVAQGKPITIKDGGGPQFKDIFKQIGRQQTKSRF